VAAKNGLACLLNENPFAGINGSGKLNNWTLATDEGVQLLKPSSLSNATDNSDAFPVVMAALVSGIDKHGDLLHAAVASPGNDFRLGAHEATPIVMSTYLGDDMTKYLRKFMKGESALYTPSTTELSFGVASIAPIEVPAEDCNCTSPLAYSGDRFQFRAVGSSQNVSLVNTVLNTLTAEGFKVISDRVEAGEEVADVARDLLKTHFKCIYNGNCYGQMWPAIAHEKGIWQIECGVEALQCLSAEKNTQLFSQMGVLSPEECKAREEVLLEHYSGTVEIECRVMVDMINQHVIPSARNSGIDKWVSDLQEEVARLEQDLVEMRRVRAPNEKAKLARKLRLETMEDIRMVCDTTEALVPAQYWTLATYRELLFLDTHRT